MHTFNKCSTQVNTMLLVVFILIISAEVIKSRFLVKTLPGLVGDLPFILETGVGKYDDVQLFYCFIESEGNPKDDPLILWISGGPGCSSMYALFYEIGMCNLKDLFSLIKTC
ncbi:putative sinapoylglucose--sinapoylglucose O-sinapoyltransferase [Helianthus anomalus]